MDPLGFTDSLDLSRGEYADLICLIIDKQSELSINFLLVLDVFWS